MFRNLKKIALITLVMLLPVIFLSQAADAGLFDIFSKKTIESCYKDKNWECLESLALNSLETYNKNETDLGGFTGAGHTIGPLTAALASKHGTKKALSKINKAISCSQTKWCYQDNILVNAARVLAHQDKNDMAKDLILLALKIEESFEGYGAAFLLPKISGEAARVAATLMGDRKLAKHISDEVLKLILPSLPPGRPIRFEGLSKEDQKTLKSRDLFGVIFGVMEAYSWIGDMRTVTVLPRELDPSFRRLYSDLDNSRVNDFTKYFRRANSISTQRGASIIANSFAQTKRFRWAFGILSGIQNKRSHPFNRSIYWIGTSLVKLSRIPEARLFYNLSGNKQGFFAVQLARKIKEHGQTEESKIIPESALLDNSKSLKIGSSSHLRTLSNLMLLMQLGQVKQY
jgi:hypothetical protein